MATRFMPYNSPHFRYLMINKYHDAIHDYGTGTSDGRWKKVQTQLVKFDPTRFTFGGARAKTVNKSNSALTTRRLHSLTKKYTQSNKTLKIKQTPINTLTASTITSLSDYEDAYNTLFDFTESVNTKICFNTFYSIIYQHHTFELIFDWRESDISRIMPYGSNLSTLYTRISYYVRLFFGNDVNVIINHFLDISPDPTNLFHNLYKYILIAIYDTANIQQKNINTTIKRGGAKTVDEKLDNDELTELIRELQSEKDKLLNDIDSIYTAFKTNPDEYSRIRISALSTIKDILIREPYKQMNKAGTVDNASRFLNKCSFLPPIPKSSRQANKTRDEFINECFLDYYDTALIGYYNGILNGLKADEESERLRIEREEIRKATGQLTQDQRFIRNQFCSLIAKLGLILNMEYNVDGTQIRVPNIQNIDDTMTAKDVNLLANWANWKWSSDYHNTKILLSNAKINIDTDLFNETHYHFRNYQFKSDDYPICKTRTSLQYIIDNAAIVPNNLKKYVFCPVSSVVDGMSKCNITQLEEHGVMDFLICEKEQYNLYINNVPSGETPSRNDPYTRPITPSISDTITHYYNGRSIYDTTTDSTEYIIELLTPFFTEPLELRKHIKLAGMELEAHNVLRETLVNIISFINKLYSFYPIISTCVFQNANGIFGGLYDCLFNTNYEDDTVNTNLPVVQYEFLRVILNILFKGAGDFFQEINAACKWGGYSDKYDCNRNVVSYKLNSDKTNNGNALRMFITNDQPSGCRFAFLLLNGYKDFINEYAFGGYMGIGKKLLVTRADIDISGQFRNIICNPTLEFRNATDIQQGGGKQTKRKKSNK